MKGTRKNSEMDAFNDAMDMILRADPKTVKESMEAEKRANAERRQAMRKPSASRRAVSGKD